MFQPAVMVTPHPVIRRPLRWWPAGSSSTHVRLFGSTATSAPQPRPQCSHPAPTTPTLTTTTTTTAKLTATSHQPSSRPIDTPPDTATPPQPTHVTSNFHHCDQYYTPYSLQDQFHSHLDNCTFPFDPQPPISHSTTPTPYLAFNPTPTTTQPLSAPPPLRPTPP